MLKRLPSVEPFSDIRPTVIGTPKLPPLHSPQPVPIPLNMPTSVDLDDGAPRSHLYSSSVVAAASTPIPLVRDNSLAQDSNSSTPAMTAMKIEHSNPVDSVNSKQTENGPTTTTTTPKASGLSTIPSPRIHQGYAPTPRPAPHLDAFHTRLGIPTPGSTAAVRDALTRCSHEDLLAHAIYLYEQLHEMPPPTPPVPAPDLAETFNISLPAFNEPTFVGHAASMVRRKHQLQLGSGSNPGLQSISLTRRNLRLLAEQQQQRIVSPRGVVSYVPSTVVTPNNDNLDCTIAVTTPGNEEPLVILISPRRESITSAGSDHSGSDGGRDSPKLSTGVRSNVDSDGYELINEYQVIDEIGRGQCGRVMLAISTKTSEPRAIKIIPSALLNPAIPLSSSGKLTEAQLKVLTAPCSNSNNNCKPINGVNEAALQVEVAVLKKLRHKHIVALYEVIHDTVDEKLYLVMQFAEKGPVVKFNDAGKCEVIPEDKVKKYARQLCSGMSYLMRHNVVHRDIKPDNILLDRNDDILIADFGVSEFVESPKAMKTPRTPNRQQGNGTPAFMAPEVLQGKPATFESDIWSLGVSLYAMLFGVMPWASPSWSKTMELVQTAPLPIPLSPEVSPEAVDMLQQMLAKDPAERLTLQELRRHPFMDRGDSLTPLVSPIPIVLLGSENLGEAYFNTHMMDLSAFEVEAALTQRSSVENAYEDARVRSVRRNSLPSNNSARGSSKLLTPMPLPVRSQTSYHLRGHLASALSFAEQAEAIGK